MEPILTETALPRLALCAAILNRCGHPDALLQIRGISPPTIFKLFDPAELISEQALCRIFRSLKPPMHMEDFLYETGLNPESSGRTGHTYVQFELGEANENFSGYFKEEATRLLSNPDFRERNHRNGAWEECKQAFVKRLQMMHPEVPDPLPRETPLYSKRTAKSSPSVWVERKSGNSGGGTLPGF